MWVPLMQLTQLAPERVRDFDERGNNFTRVIARLAPGVTIDRARDRMKSIVAQLTQELPDQYRDSGVLLVLKTEAGIHPQFRTATLGLTSVVMAVVVMLLLIACVNVANLFLARARDRWREMAVRLSLGANRWRLVRQLMTESLVFGVLAGVAGLMLAWWAIRIAGQIRPPIDAPIDADLRLNLPVLLFSLGISLVTALVFGLAPALQATRPALVPSLKGEAPAGGSRSRMSRGLIVVQMALSLILLVSAGLFLRNLRAATTIDKGFVAEHQLLADVDPGLQGYSRSRTEDFYRRLGERLRSVPGVTAVAFGETVPLGLSNQQTSITIPGYTPAPNESMSIDYNRVTPGYFEAMGIPIRRGRAFTVQDDSTASRVLIVNERFAQRFWPGKDAVGQQLRMGSRDVTIVGVVPDGKYRTLGEEPLAYMYLPQAQSWSSAMVVHVRTSGDPVSLVPVLRREVAALDPDLPLSNVRSMVNHLGITLLPARIAGGVLGVFGVLGLLLAAVGMYGVMSYSVAQRTREIGIRVAIGAARGQVLRLVLTQGMSLVGAGTLIGIAGAVGAARLVRGLMYGGTTLDPLTLGGVALVLLGVAALAIWVPARRAAAIDPMTAIRVE
jgi:predicted permease